MSHSLLRRLWFDGLMFVCNHLVGHVPSHSLRRWFYRAIMRFDLGERAFIFMGAHFDTRGQFKLGDYSTINQDCRLDNRGGLEIGSNVSISAAVYILTADHDPQSARFAGRTRPVRIGDYVFVGTRAIILPGVTIGRGGVVAAGSVVTKDVAECSIVAGSPAREIGTRRADLSYQIGYYRFFA
jgi:acetyltransferase-like isoleucine patch superfamily enzyme